MSMVNLVEKPFKLEATEAIKPFTWYGKFAIAPVEIPFKQRNSHCKFGGDTIQIGSHRSN